MIQKKSRLYLAHSCELINSIRHWEVKIEAKYRIDLINPFRNNKWENIAELRKLKSRKKVIEYMNERLTPDINRKIVKYDLKLLRQCDGIVAVFNEVSVGTVQEVFAAWYLYNMPVYIINNKYENHPWLQEIIRLSGGEMFKTRRAFEKYLDNEKLRRE